MLELVILVIPFLGTTLGAAMIFLFKQKLNEKFEKILLGFAAGVMIAASIWSLIIPSFEMSEGMGKLSILPPAIGFCLGMIFLLVLDSVIPHMHSKDDQPEGIKTKKSKTSMFLLAITLHNIPEGMSVGVLLSGIIFGDNVISISSALVLALGIAIQNFPEGTIVSFPLYQEGNSKAKSCLLGVLSGVVEPIAALLTMFLASLFVPILPYLLSFASGAMIYVVVDELIPESQNGNHSNLGMIGVMVGFVLMMVLDVVLG